MQNHPLFWLLVSASVVLSILLYRLWQLNRRLNHVLKYRLNKSAAQQHFLLVPRQILMANTFVFFAILGIILIVFIYLEFLYKGKQDIVVCTFKILMVTGGLFSSFLLGGSRSRAEAAHHFTQYINQTSQREWVERKLSLNEARLIKQQQTLAALVQVPNRNKHELCEIFKEYTQAAAETLDVERVSIWLNNVDNTELECIDFYIKSSNTHSILESVLVSEIPHYYDALALHRIIVADDAMHHPELQELADGYLQTNNIGALLDSGVWLDGRAAGVVCIEHVGGVRAWASDEQTFAGAIADLVRVSIETYKRRIAEQALEDRSLQLEQMVQTRTLSLQESNQRFSYVVQEVPIAILIMDRNGNIVDANEEAIAASGYRREEMLGMHFIKKVVAKESRPQAAIMAARTLRGENFRRVELLLQNAAGEKYAYECSIGMTAKSASDGSGLMVAIAQNISEQKALQESLINAREAAEAADRTKSMFVAAMSHELRTPLNSIIGFLGVVLQGVSGEINPIQKSQLERAYQSSRHLLLLISDVLDVSKIEAGFLQMNTEKFELKPLLIELEHAVQHLLVGKKLELRIACTAKLQVTTDRKRLYQALLNVLSNAVKYTEQGSIEMKAHIENDQLIVSCKDTGIGIAQTDFAKLFQPFERAESVLKIKTTGTGLGLYLTHQIITQLLGGSINLQSKLGQGSTFTITMPANTPLMVTKNI